MRDSLAVLKLLFWTMSKDNQSELFFERCSTITLPAGDHRHRASQESAVESAQACGPAHLLLSGETLAGHLRPSGKKRGLFSFFMVMPRRETWTEELWHANRRRSSHVPACRWVQWPVTRDGFVGCVIPRMYRYVGIPVSWSSDSKTTVTQDKAGTTLRPHLKLFFWLPFILLNYTNIQS